MLKRFLTVLVAAVALMLPGSASTTAALPYRTYAPGYDVSYPQCRLHLPAPATFAIVGVNSGSMFTGNPCTKRELTWAARSSTLPGQPPASVYVNTGDLGPRAAHWPKSNRDPMTARFTRDRYGTCRGRNTAACAWQYGWNAGEDDIVKQQITSPASYTWWLDVELTNTWQTNKTLNRAVLTGMVDYLESRGLTVGLYSTWAQWFEIAGPVAESNPLSKLPEWVSGASNRDNADTACWHNQFMIGGTILLSQWYTASSLVDGDVRCPPSGFRPIRIGY